MTGSPPTRRALLVALLTAVAATAAGCGDTREAATGGSGALTPINIGVVYSATGPQTAYGRQYVTGFTAGLAYATSGTSRIGERSINVTYADDAGDPDRAAAAAELMIGQGYRVIAGSTTSASALRIAPIATRHRVLFVSGSAASDAITGANRYTFRSGREYAQDVQAAKVYLGTGRRVLVFAPDSAFGADNLAAVRAVLGGAATVSSITAPADTADFTAYASKIKAEKPDLLYVAWGGGTAAALWQALDQHGVLAATTVATSMDVHSTWKLFGPAAGKVHLVTPFFNGAVEPWPPFASLRAQTPGGKPDLASPDGFAAAQMIVRALQSGPDDVDGMIRSLEGYTFDSAKGTYWIRPQDHALLQPMFRARLIGSSPALTAVLTGTVSAEDAAPPLTTMRG